jgi:DNA-binding CsgD family transcriptional regulator
VEEVANLRRSNLTPREREVVKLIAEGNSARKIAGALGLSVKTVEAHRFNLMRKLDIRDPEENCARARRGLAGISLLCTIRINQNFARFPRLQAFHSLRKIPHRDAVGDDRMQVELAVFEQSRHLIPGLVHAAAINALDGDALEDNVLGKIERNWF